MKREATIKAINNYLIEKYGNIRPEWETVITLLSDCLNRYEQVKEALDTYGVFDPETGKKNQLITSEKDLIATILKLAQKLGISPWDASKIKDSAVEDEEDFIENLTND